MAALTYPTALCGPDVGAITRINLGPIEFALLAPGRSLHDFRYFIETSGVLTDRVMFKATPSSPEQPFVKGRVWLLRLLDGHKAWEGWSDADGYYTATNLEIGVEYVAVGIDPWRNFKATGAGQVIATRP